MELSTAEIVLSIILLVTVAIATVIDVRERRIPNWLTGTAAIAALAAGLALDPGDEKTRVIAAFAGATFLFAAAMVNPAGLGMGDVKLMFVIGLCLGKLAFTALLVALITGTALGLVIALRHGTKEARKTTIPFGPFLALGSVTGVVLLAIGIQPF